MNTLGNPSVVTFVIICIVDCVFFSIQVVFFAGVAGEPQEKCPKKQRINRCRGVSGILLAFALFLQFAKYI